MKYTDYYQHLKELSINPTFDKKGFGSSFLLYPDGKKKKISPKNKTVFEHSEVERYLGKDLFVIPMKHPNGFSFYMIISRDDAHQDYNEFATGMLYTFLKQNIELYGTVLVCHESQFER